jgi:hypothetical protein
MASRAATRISTGTPSASRLTRKTLTRPPCSTACPATAASAPHWGVVLKGKLVYNYADGTQDVIQAGEAYYAPPGHLPVFAAGTEIAEFSPRKQLRAAMEVVTKNVLAAGQA